MALSNDSNERFEDTTAHSTSPIYKAADSVGIVMTVGSYAVGLSSLVTSQPWLGQKMMYARVAFQGMTIAAMFYDQWLDRKTKDRNTYKHHQHSIQRDLSVYPPTD